MTATTDGPLDLARTGWASVRVPDDNAEAFLRGVVDLFAGPDGPWWRVHLGQVVAQRVDARAAALAALPWSEYDDVRLGEALVGALSAEIALRVFLPPEWSAAFTLRERRVLFETLLTVHALVAMDDDPLATVLEPAEATLDPWGRAALPAVRFNFELLSGSTVALEARRRMDLGGDRRTRTRPQSLAWLTLAVGLTERLAGDWRLVSSEERERVLADLKAMTHSLHGVPKAVDTIGEHGPDPADPRPERDAAMTLALLDAADRALYAPGGLVAVVRAALGTTRRAGNALRREARRVRTLRDQRRRDEPLADTAPVTADDAPGAELRAAEMLALLFADERGRSLFEGDDVRPDVAAAVAALPPEGRISQADIARWLGLSDRGAFKWRERMKARHRTDR